MSSSDVFPEGFKSLCTNGDIDGGGGIFILVRKDIDHAEDAFLDVDESCESVLCSNWCSLMQNSWT